ncbi:MAG: TetR family transcriptional regulator [Dehalococcoidales bacterium]|nr:TetR family transcriptional regulator [Dehalococcoidales bacterium]
MKNRKYEAQKNEILEVARKLFWEKGYDGTSLKDIGSACGFENTNIYYYYKNKEEILFEALRIELDSLVNGTKHLKKPDSGNPVERLKRFIDIELKKHLGEHRLQGMLIDSELNNLTPEHRNEVVSLRDEHDDILSQIISDGIGQRYFREVNVKLTVYTVSSAIIRSRIWFSPTGSVSIQDYADFIFQFTFNAIKSG